jgi:hypothetical protein
MERKQQETRACRRLARFAAGAASYLGRVPVRWIVLVRRLALCHLSPKKKKEKNVLFFFFRVIRFDNPVDRLRCVAVLCSFLSSFSLVLLSSISVSFCFSLFIHSFILSFFLPFFFIFCCNSVSFFFLLQMVLASLR